MSLPMTDLIGRTPRVACMKCHKPTAQTKDTEVAGVGHICLACRASVCGCGCRARTHPWVAVEVLGVPDRQRGPCRARGCGCAKMNPAKTPWGAALLLGCIKLEATE